MTRLTLVTITRNDLAGLQRTFASLSGQTFGDVEHLIIDGGSSDGSPAWATANAQFANTVVTSEPDGGIYDAMNEGLRRATGEVICFLNSGDCFTGPGVLQSAMTSFEAEQWDWAFGMGQMVDESFTPVRAPQRPQYSWRRQTYWIFEIYHQAVFMRTSFLRELGGFDDRFSIAGDYHLMTKAGRRARPVVIPELLALNLSGGVSHARPNLAQWEAHQARIEILRMGRIRAGLDGLWTRALIAKTHARRTARRAASAGGSRPPLGTSR